MRVVFSADCVLHAPPHELLSGNLVSYLEAPARYSRIRDALSLRPPHSDALFDFVEADSERDVRDFILAVHEKDYLEYIQSAYSEWVKYGGNPDGILPECFAHPALSRGKKLQSSQLPPIGKAGLYCFDLSCPIVEDTYKSALAAVNVALTASRILISEIPQPQISGNSTAAPPPGVFALTRPPGHHAGPAVCGGYCFFNNAAIAVRFLQSQGNIIRGLPLDKVAILDVDYHHGNGTQEIFYEDPTVFYVSLHAAHDYPYFTGDPGERGAGNGMGFNLNIPLPQRSTGDIEYCNALRGALHHIRYFDPAVLVVSLGVDTYMDDPICNFNLTDKCYASIGLAIATLRKPTLFIMEGGYDLETIGTNVRLVLKNFLASQEIQKP